VTRTEWGTDTGWSRSYLPAKVERFRVALTDPGFATADDVEVTEFAYRFRTVGGDDVCVVEAKSEWDGAAFNGPGSEEDPEFVVTHELLDEVGRNVWSRAADGSLTRREFDPASGRVTLVERNAAPPGDWDIADAAWDVGGLDGSFAGSNGAGGSLTTTMSYDLLGRIQSQTTAAGVTTYLTREMRACDELQGLPCLAVVSLPAELGEDDHAGPATITWLDAGGNELATWNCAVSGEYTIDSDPSGWPVPVTSYSIEMDPSLLLGRSRTDRAISGQVRSVKQWHTPSGDGPDGGFSTTRYGYDALGRHPRHERDRRPRFFDRGDQLPGTLL